ncbi:MAG: hypothetical protein U0K35_08525 [Prevotella sp.]|nr:hypothetical protein [Prevotella sp.]
MKKEYVKPTLLVLATEPSQIMVGSPGSEEGDEKYDWDSDGDGIPDSNGNEDESEGETVAKGGLWDEYTW